MNERPVDDDSLPARIDFSKGARGLHHIPPGAKVFLPVSIERSVWEYFAAKAEEKGHAFVGSLDRRLEAGNRD